MMTTDPEPLTAEEIERRRKAHRKQEFYRGEATPNRSNHKTGAVAVCASCHQAWPCEASRLLATLDTRRASDAQVAALERIRDLTLDVPAAHGDPESYYLGQLRTAIGTAARALATPAPQPAPPLD